MIKKFSNFIPLSVSLVPIFAISGPFLPDLVVSFSAIFFLVYVIKNGNYSYFQNRFFIVFIFFYLILILSSIFSEYQSSLKTSVTYLRFGILVLLVSFLVKTYRKFTLSTLKILLIALFVLTLDASFQKIFGYNFIGFEPPHGRITSFFGEDIKLGGFIVRILPLIISLLIFHNFKNHSIILTILAGSYLCILSGERTSILMIMMFIFLFLIQYKLNLKYKFYILIIPIVLVYTSIYFNETIRYRLFTTTLSQLNFSNQQSYVYEKNLNGHNVLFHQDSTLFPRVYHMYFETAIKIWKDNIYLGSGPRTYKHASKDDKYFTISNHDGMLRFIELNNEPLKNLSQENLVLVKEKIGIYPIYSYPGFTDISGANNHPHNIYLQLLSEVGLLGFIFVSTIFLYSLVLFFSNLPSYKKVILIGILINLFPFMFSGNFFNNWLSILYFFPIGFLFLDNKEYGIN